MVHITSLLLSASSRSTWQTLYAAWLSSPLVGSSRKTMLGSVTSSVAMAVRFFSPPEMPLIMAEPTYASAHLAIPKLSSRSTQRFARASLLMCGKRNLAANLRVSRGVAVANSASSCMT
mmetsp:Transcript_45463/g.120027  ORF Transcript_45463/g.120027 Transcript_45463/m.120027 type:complete len:119 (+) Transcript_45463:1186-1542(+)